MQHVEVEPRYGHEPAPILLQKQMEKTARKPLDLHKSRDNVTQDHVVSVCNFYFDVNVFKQLLTSNLILSFFTYCLFSEIKLGGNNKWNMQDKENVAGDKCTSDQP